MIRMYGLATCDTVRKARAWFEVRGLAYEFVDFRKVPPTAERLEHWCRALGSDVVVNRRGTTWRKLGADIQARMLTLEDTVAVLMEYPSLVRRPVVELRSELLIGFEEEEYARRIYPE